MKLTPTLLGSDLMADWIRYTDVQEAPQSMLMVSALTIFSAVVERRLWIRRGYMKRSNVYTILLGPPATRKGQAMKLALDLFVGAGYKPQLFGQYNATDEGIVSALAEIEKEGGSASGLLYAEELGTLIGSKQYQENFMKFLTRAYDGGELEATRKKKSYGCRDGQLALLGATTPADFRSLPHDVVTTGLMSRTWLVSEDGPMRDVSRPKFDAAMREDIERRLRERLDRLFTVGFIAYEPGQEAGRVFDDFYLGEHARMKRECDPIMRDWTGRRHDHALVAAVLMHLFDGGKAEEELGDKAMLRGIEFIKAMEPGIFDAYGATLMGEWGRKKQWAVEWLRSQKGASGQRFKSAIGGRSRVAGEGEKMLKELEEEGEIVFDERKGMWRIVE